MGLAGPENVPPFIAAQLSHLLSNFGHTRLPSQDLRLLGALLDIFPFASDDMEARNAPWNVIARVLVRVRETEMSPSSLHHYVSVLVGKLDPIEDELLNQQVEHGHEQESLYSPGSAASTRNTPLRRIISILNQWTAGEENDGNAEVPM